MWISKTKARMERRQKVADKARLEALAAKVRVVSLSPSPLFCCAGEMLWLMRVCNADERQASGPTQAQAGPDEEGGALNLLRFSFSLVRRSALSLFPTFASTHSLSPLSALPSASFPMR
jgi:hypothetical protein